MAAVMPPPYQPGRLQAFARRANPRPAHGRVTRALGPIIHAVLPGATIGELLHISSGDGTVLPAEVLGVEGDVAILAPIGNIQGLIHGCPVRRTGGTLRVPVGPAVLGRVLDGLGRPLDIPSALFRAMVTRPCQGQPMDALRRGVIKHPFPVGVRIIDGLLTCGEGQRIGVFGEPGSGKSVLLGQIVRGAAADVVVVGLIGERGREVGEFIEDHLSSEVRARSVVVVATSDRPALERMRAAHTATTIAEAFRDEGRRVLLVIDSITRFARAMREVGLAAGEPPTRRGFPPSVLAQLPQLLERPGLAAPQPGMPGAGSITAFYTVLMEGDGTDDPIAEETRSLLDGHIVLSPKLAASGQFPAIDVSHSRSRVMDRIVSEPHRQAASRVRALIHRHEETEFLLQVGEYRAGADPLTDEALAKIDAIRAFLTQMLHTTSPFSDTVSWLARLAG